MILTQEALKHEIACRSIVIEPFVEENVGTASVDLTISNQFRRVSAQTEEIEISADSKYRQYTELIEADEYVLEPRGFVLAITKEKISMPKNICGWINTRSSFARLGLMVHMTAPFVNPDTANNQLLELFNATDKPMRIKAGTKICHMIFERCEGQASYNGKNNFTHQQL